MSTEIVLIDTNLWHFSLATSKESSWQALHDQAAEFISRLLQDDDILIALSSYQIAEILDLLRKVRYPSERRHDLIRSFRDPKFRVVEVTHDTAEKRCLMSLVSGIHVYDYLVALPLKGIVTAIYSADDHFLHPDFQAVAPVTNPLSPWVLREGRQPMRD